MCRKQIKKTEKHQKQFRNRPAQQIRRERRAKSRKEDEKASSEVKDDSDITEKATLTEYEAVVVLKVAVEDTVTACVHIHP